MRSKRVRYKFLGAIISLSFFIQELLIFDRGRKKKNTSNVVCTYLINETFATWW